MKHYIHLLCLLCAVFLFSCNGKKEKPIKPIGDRGYTIEYAKGFTVHKTPTYTEVSVIDPWDSTKVMQTYILVDKSKELPADLPKGTVIRTPLESVAASSTVHCSSLNELQAVGIIKGVRDANYINLPIIKNGLANKSITDLGSAGTTDVEKIIDLAPEAIFVEPIKGMSLGAIEKINIPIIQTPDYMESTALGRAEWIRFYSLFINKEALADSLYEATRNSYNEIKGLITDSIVKPIILTNLQYQGVWNVGGGKSFVVNMFHDAGALSPWNEDESTGSLSLSFEEVLDKAEGADFWLIQYNNPTKDMTLSSLKKEYNGYSKFEAFKNKKVYGANLAQSLYYEDLPIHPDYILKELVALFHPELLPDYQLRYYKKLED